MAVPNDPGRTMSGKVPVRESAAQGLRLLRDQWRLVLSVAVIGALAQTTIFTLFGGTLIVLALGALAAAPVHAAYVSAAQNGRAPTTSRLFEDAGRVVAAVGMVGLFLAMLTIVFVLAAMSVLLGPHAEEIRAAEQNQAEVAAIVERAISAQPQLVFAMLVVFALVWLWATSRFYLAAPASVEERRVVVFDSWTWTRGNTWRIVAARLSVLAPALVLTAVVQLVFGMALGVPTADLIAMSNSAGANPWAFVVFFTLCQFVQIALYASCEASLAAYLYRGLRPAVATPTAAPSTDSGAVG